MLFTLKMVNFDAKNGNYNPIIEYKDKISFLRMKLLFFGVKKSLFLKQKHWLENKITTNIRKTISSIFKK